MRAKTGLVLLVEPWRPFARQLVAKRIQLRRMEKDRDAALE